MWYFRKRDRKVLSNWGYGKHMDLCLATEDALSEAVGERLVSEVGGMNIVIRMGGNGNGYLRRKLPELARLAPSVPVLLLTDLDRIECPPALIRTWSGNRRLPDNLLLRVVVREVETWLLADRDAFADFSGVPSNRLPQNPEALADPKRSLLNLVKRYGRRLVKQDILPAPDASATCGLGYNQILCGFVRNEWSPERAEVAADSLARARSRLAELGEQGGEH